MKFNKKLAAYLFAIVLFVTYLFSANYIFNVLFKPADVARYVNMSLPPKTENIKFNIDVVKRSRLGWHDVLLMRGWVFKENVKEKERDVYLVLKSNSNTMVFEIEKDSIPRPGVTSTFKMKGGANSHGFEVNLPTYYLKEDTYKIGFVIEDKTGKYYEVSKKELKISDSTVSIYKMKSKSKQKSSKVQKPS